ncbi:MAG: DUF1295 domain-containing protein [archaeon]|nr:DUF1295 domain-containing protein [archaeon]
MDTLPTFLLLCLLSALSCSIGFITFLWFISIGYGLAIAVLGISMLIIYSTSLTLGTILLNICLIIYGFRLSGYLLIRELRSNYKSEMGKDITDGSQVKMFAKCMIWTSCAILYVLMVSPVFFRLANKDGSDIITYIGVITTFGGIVLESAADVQKYIAKKSQPKKIVTTGLFKIVRCPNYLGECICWTGIFISGFSSLNGTWQWISAFLGWVLIVWIMFGGCRRLEIRQNKRYKDDKDYQIYYKTTPVIIPGIPLYSVEKYKWLVG